jgi:hypothetical protein
MTRRLLQGIVGLALAVGIGMMAAKAMLAGQTPAGGQTADQRLHGAWLVTVTRTNPTPPTPPRFLSLVTFTPGGQAFEESNTPRIRSVAHGEWVRTGDRQFTRSHVSFIFDSARTFTRFTRLTVKMRLNRRGDQFRGMGIVQAIDTNGIVLRTDTSMEVGRRCGVYTSTRRCLGIE